MGPLRQWQSTGGVSKLMAAVSVDVRSVVAQACVNGGRSLIPTLSTAVARAHGGGCRRCRQENLGRELLAWEPWWQPLLLAIGSVTSTWGLCWIRTPCYFRYGAGQVTVITDCIPRLEIWFFSSNHSCKKRETNCIRKKILV